MPYAVEDRQEFIKRSGIAPGTRTLDLGGVLYEEFPSAVSGITARKQLSNAVVMKPALVPFKDAAFDAVVSYHYFDLLPSDLLGYVFKEAARMLKKDSNFSFMRHHGRNNKTRYNNTQGFRTVAPYASWQPCEKGTGKRCRRDQDTCKTVL
jgi:hypothetical protein